MVVDALILLMTGLFAGFIGGLFGIGGGVVIVPALYAVFGAQDLSDDVRIKVALGTSLATIIVTSIRSVQGHARHGAVDWAILRRWTPGLALGAIAGAVVARFVDATFLTLIFGIGIGAVALQRLISANRPARTSGQLPSVPVQNGLAGGVGLFSSLMGIGGGVIGVILLTRAGRSVHQAIGTAAGFGLAIAVPGALGYMLGGMGQTDQPWTIGFISLPAFAMVAMGTALSTPLGAQCAARSSPVILMRLFALYAGLTSIKMIADGLF